MTFDEKELFDLEALCSYSKYEITQVKKIVAQPDFPRPIRVLERSRPRWVARDVMEYFEARRDA